MRAWLLVAVGFAIAACEPQARQRASEASQAPSAATANSSPQAPVWQPERITVEELAVLMKSADPPYLVDVRNAEAFKRSHIKGAHSVPGPDHFAVLNGLKKDRLMVLYCT